MQNRARVGDRVIESRALFSLNIFFKKEPYNTQSFPHKSTTIHIIFRRRDIQKRHTKTTYFALTQLAEAPRAFFHEGAL